MDDEAREFAHKEDPKGGEEAAEESADNNWGGESGSTVTAAAAAAARGRACGVRGHDNVGVGIVHLVLVSSIANAKNENGHN